MGTLDRRAGFVHWQPSDWNTSMAKMDMRSSTDSGELVSCCVSIWKYSPLSSPAAANLPRARRVARPTSLPRRYAMIQCSSPSRKWRRSSQGAWPWRCTVTSPSGLRSRRAATAPLAPRISSHGVPSPCAPQPVGELALSSEAPVPPLPPSGQRASGGPQESRGGRPAASMMSTVRSILLQGPWPSMERDKDARSGHTAGETGTSRLRLRSEHSVMRERGTTKDVPTWGRRGTGSGVAHCARRDRPSSSRSSSRSEHVAAGSSGLHADTSALASLGARYFR
mmetsp:Transcript_94662/g.276770  ORF Transcript_94662/g.276770 Transcript_94662/m.276770 type:complete len:281 (-) Transcript_94662:701-1543(-)